MKTKLLLGLVCLLLLSVSFASTYQTSIHSPSVSITPQLDSPGSFQTDLFPGSATYSFDILIAPARSISPSISLYYNSHMTKSVPTELESAWSLSQNYISRDSKGTNEDELTLVFMGQSHKLVEVDVFEYKTKFETFMQIKTGFDDTFTIKTSDGSTHYFDKTIAGPYTNSLNAKYYLTKSVDTFGNTVEYFYGTFSGSKNVLYLDHIIYDDVKRVDFYYETRPTSYSTYQDGLEIKYSHRLGKIISSFDGETVAEYRLEYTTVGEYKQFLQNIRRIADDEQVVTFSYNEPQIGWVADSNFNLPSAASFGTDEDQGARFMDFTGDGITDFYKIYGKSETSWQIVKLEGTPTGWKSSDWDFVEQDGQITYLGLDMGFRFTDLNGDMFADVIQLQCSDAGDEEHVYINTGEEWIEDTNYAFTGLPCIIDYSDIENEGVIFIDVNKDGFADILESKGSDNDVHINLGDGTGWDTNAWNVPTTFYSSSGTDNGVRLADINGDGLPDIIENKGYDQQVWLNNGFGWEETTEWAPLDEFEFIEIRSGPDDDKGVRLADVDGDGLIDVLRADGDDNFMKGWLNTGTGWAEFELDLQTFFVDDYNDNLGVRIVDFNGDTYPDIVLANDNEQKSWKHIGDSNYYLNEITYENIIQPRTEISYVPSTIYDNTLGGISTLGFPMLVVNKIIQSNDALENFSLSSTIIQNYSGGVYDTDEKQFTGFRTVTTKDYDTISISQFHQDFQRRGKIKSSSIQDLDNNVLQEMFYTWSFEENNGVFNTQLDKIQTIDYGINTQRSSSSTYTYDDYNNIIVETQNGEDYKLGDEKYTYTNYTINTNKWILHSPSAIIKIDSESNILSQAQFAYDGLTVGDAPNKGALTQESVWDGNKYITSTYTYNEFGNLLTETDPKGYTTTYSYGESETTNTLPDSITNTLGFTTSFTYDMTFGNVLTETDTNGKTTSYYYDDIGRPIAVTYAGESKNRTSLKYNSGINLFATTTTELSGEDGEFENILITYIDTFGNAIMTKQYRNGINDYIGTITYYNPDMSVREKSVGFDSSSPVFNPSESAQTISYEYDVLDRTLKVTNPDGSSKKTIFNAWEKTSYDEENNSITYFYDGYKRVLAVQENNDADEYMTFYEYDGNDNIVSITRSDGSKISYTYDSLGRIITETDDEFTKTYSYDDVGNTIAIKYPTRKESFKYDELSRITEKRSGNEVFDFYYDEQLNGTLSRVVGTDYEKELFYDDLYRVNKKITTIIDEEFTVEYVYGYNDELLDEVYPEETITYEYDFQGKVSVIDSIASFIYTALGIVDEIRFENSRVSDYEYNATSLRLSTINYGDSKYLTYSYTDAGLISAITGLETQELAYDDLSRIKTETRNGLETIFTIDSVGRIIQKETSNETLLFTYDAFDAPTIISSVIEEFVSACQDGLDNDNDGYVDVEDIDCVDEFDNDESSTSSNETNGTSGAGFESQYFKAGSYIIKIPKNATVENAYITIRGTGE